MKIYEMEYFKVTTKVYLKIGGEYRLFFGGESCGQGKPWSFFYGFER
jgi:hypothetical protein